MASSGSRLYLEIPASVIDEAMRVGVAIDFRLHPTFLSALLEALVIEGPPSLAHVDKRSSVYVVAIEGRERSQTRARFDGRQTDMDRFFEESILCDDKREYGVYVYNAVTTGPSAKTSEDVSYVTMLHIESRIWAREAIRVAIHEVWKEGGCHQLPSGIVHALEVSAPESIGDSHKTIRTKVLDRCFTQEEREESPSDTWVAPSWLSHSVVIDRYSAYDTRVCSEHREESGGFTIAKAFAYTATTIVSRGRTARNTKSRPRHTDGGSPATPTPHVAVSVADVVSTSSFSALDELVAAMDSEYEDRYRGKQIEESDTTSCLSNASDAEVFATHHGMSRPLMRDLENVTEVPLVKCISNATYTWRSHHRWTSPMDLMVDKSLFDCHTVSAAAFSVLVVFRSALKTLPEEPCICKICGTALVSVMGLYLRMKVIVEEAVNDIRPLVSNDCLCCKLILAIMSCIICMTSGARPDDYGLRCKSPGAIDSECFSSRNVIFGFGIPSMGDVAGMFGDALEFFREFSSVAEAQRNTQWNGQRISYAPVSRGRNSTESFMMGPCKAYRVSVRATAMPTMCLDPGILDTTAFLLSQSIPIGEHVQTPAFCRVGFGEVASSESAMHRLGRLYQPWYWFRSPRLNSTSETNARQRAKTRRVLFGEKCRRLRMGLAKKPLQIPGLAVECKPISFCVKTPWVLSQETVEHLRYGRVHDMFFGQIAPRKRKRVRRTTEAAVSVVGGADEGRFSHPEDPSQCIEDLLMDPSRATNDLELDRAIGVLIPVTHQWVHSWPSMVRSLVCGSAEAVFAASAWLRRHVYNQRGNIDGTMGAGETGDSREYRMFDISLNGPDPPSVAARYYRMLAPLLLKVVEHESGDSEFRPETLSKMLLRPFASPGSSEVEASSGKGLSSMDAGARGSTSIYGGLWTFLHPKSTHIVLHGPAVDAMLKAIAKVLKTGLEDLSSRYIYTDAQRLLLFMRDNTRTTPNKRNLYKFLNPAGDLFEERMAELRDSVDSNTKAWTALDRMLVLKDICKRAPPHYVLYECAIQPQLPAEVTAAVFHGMAMETKWTVGHPMAQYKYTPSFTPSMPESRTMICSVGDTRLLLEAIQKGAYYYRHHLESYEKEDPAPMEEGSVLLCHLFGIVEVLSQIPVLEKVPPVAARNLALDFGDSISLPLDEMSLTGYIGQGGSVHRGMLSPEALSSLYEIRGSGDGHDFHYVVDGEIPLLSSVLSSGDYCVNGASKWPMFEGDLFPFWSSMTLPTVLDSATMRYNLCTHPSRHKTASDLAPFTGAHPDLLSCALWNPIRKLSIDCASNLYYTLTNPRIYLPHGQQVLIQGFRDALRDAETSPEETPVFGKRTASFRESSDSSWSDEDDPIRCRLKRMRSGGLSPATDLRWKTSIEESQMYVSKWAEDVSCS